MPPPFVPRNPSDLTPTTLTSMLSSILPVGAKVASVDVKVLTNGGNTGAILTRCTLEYEGNDTTSLPHSMVCKMIDTSQVISPSHRDSPFERAIMLSTGYSDPNMLRLEASFYNEYAPSKVFGEQTTSPKCYFACNAGKSTRFSRSKFIAFKIPEHVRGAVLMEDLGAGKTFDAVSDAPEDIIKEILLVAARLHGHSARVLKTQPKSIPHSGRRLRSAPNYDMNCMTKGLAYFVKEMSTKSGLTKRALKMWGDTSPITLLKTDPEVYAACESFEKAFVSKILPFVKKRHPFRCLLHGDLHAGNFYFMPPDNAHRIFDWQMWGVGPVTWELAQLFGSNIAVGDPNKDEEYLKLYHSELEKVIAGVPGLGYPWKIFRRDFDVVICDLVACLLLRRGKFETPQSIKAMGKKNGEAFVNGLEHVKLERDGRLLVRIKDIWKRNPKWDFNHIV